MMNPSHPAVEGVIPLILSQSKTSETKLAQVVEHLKRHPDQAEPFLQPLLTRPETSVRFWAGAIGAELLGKRFVPALRLLVDDRHGDVRSLAIQELGRLDPESLRLFADKFRRRLRSTKDRFVAAELLWTLATLHYREAAEDIRRFRDQPDRAIGNRRVADVVLAYLEHGPHEILRRIRDHDHEHMYQLGLAVKTLIPNVSGLKALKECAESAPDEECRGYCRGDYVALRSTLEVQGS